MQEEQEKAKSTAALMATTVAETVQKALGCAGVKKDEAAKGNQEAVNEKEKPVASSPKSEGRSEKKG
eukprot:91089-Lingulodinium_polyedra.AAC.1